MEMKMGFVLNEANPEAPPEQVHPFDRWLAEMWRIKLTSANGNRWEAWFRFALLIVDNHESLKLGDTETALRNRLGAAKNREDVIELKALCNLKRAQMATAPMSDIARFLIEEVFHAVEDLAEAEE